MDTGGVTDPSQMFEGQNSQNGMDMKQEAMETSMSASNNGNDSGNQGKIKHKVVFFYKFC